MGVTVGINSLEEMCDMMCDNKLPEEKEQWWVFTFGYGQEHAGQCVKIRGTFDEARSKMFDKYGTEWAFQYSQEQWERIKNDPLRDWPMETAVTEGREETMKNPCENCKRKPNCPKVCFPLRDYNRALYKKGRNKTNGTKSSKSV